MDGQTEAMVVMDTPTVTATATEPTTAMSQDMQQDMPPTSSSTVSPTTTMTTTPTFASWKEEDVHRANCYLAAQPPPQSAAWASLEQLSAAFPAQRTPEWLQRRKGLITGSEVAKIRTAGSQVRKSVLFQKLGVDPQPFEGNEHTAHGTLYEPVAAAAYAAQVGARLGFLNMIPHKTLPYVAFSPDGWAELADGAQRLIEIKCPSKRAVSATIPSYYVGQVQLGLHILWSHGIDVDCDFIQYFPRTEGVRDQAVLKVITVKRDPQWCADWAPRMASFWAEVEEWRARGIQTHPEHDYYVRTGYFPRIPAAVHAEWWGTASTASSSAATASATVGACPDDMDSTVDDADVNVGEWWGA